MSKNNHTTQLFYDNQSFKDFVRQCHAKGIDVPIIPGLMPASSVKQASRFCGNIPSSLAAALQEAEGDLLAAREVGIDWTTAQIIDLMDSGFKAFHLYIMNKSGMATEVIHRLRAQGYL